MARQQQGPKVHRDRNLLAVDDCGSHPGTGLVPVALKVCFSEQTLQLGTVREERWFQRQISIGGERRDRDSRITGAEVDGVRPDDDERV